MTQLWLWQYKRITCATMKHDMHATLCHDTPFCDYTRGKDFLAEARCSAHEAHLFPACCLSLSRSLVASPRGSLVPASSLPSGSGSSFLSREIKSLGATMCMGADTGCHRKILRNMTYQAIGTTDLRQYISMQKNRCQLCDGNRKSSKSRTSL